MSLMKYQPWSMFDQLHRDINELFDRRYPADMGNEKSMLGGDWNPAVDVQEKDDCFLIKADIPGVLPEQIEVSAQNGKLTIKGERKKEFDETKDGVHRVERSFGSFFRSFTLPENINAEKINAKSVHGVLEITLPKAEAKQAKKIEIKS